MTSAPTSFDRPFPQDVRAERALLGGLLLEPSELLTLGTAVAAEDFYRPEHGALFRLLEGMVREGTPIDLVTVAGRAATSPERYGGLGYVAELPEHCTATTNLRHYADAIRSRAIARKAITVALEVARDAFETDDPTALVQGAAARLSGLARPSSVDWSVGDAVEATEREDAIAHQGAALRQRMRDEGLTLDDLTPDERAIAATMPAAIPTGLPVLDAILDGGGLPGGKLTVIAAATSMGKSSLARAFALHMANEGGVAVGHFSAEEQRPEFSRKVLSALSRIPLQDLRKPDRSRYDTEVIDGWKAYIRGPDWRLRFTYTPGATLDDVATQARRWKLEHGIEVLFVDYLQAMRPRRGRERSHHDFGEIVSGLAHLGGELGIAVVLLSQITREGQKERKGPQATPPHWPRWFQHALVPRLFDMKETGEIENAADLVLFPVRGDIGGPDRTPCEGAPSTAALIKVAKQKNGPLDMVPCQWDPACAIYRPIEVPGASGSDLL